MSSFGGKNVPALEASSSSWSSSSDTGNSSRSDSWNSRDATTHYDVDYLDDDYDDHYDPPLSWRLEPLQSLSDWTIKIRSKHSGSVQEYHVHKNILAVGPCKSEYFCGLFRCSASDHNSSNSNSNNTISIAESSTRTSCITLEDSAAQAFPHLLDFLYSPARTISVTTQNAVALRYLSQYFGIRMLHKKVMEFLTKDINLGNVDSYLSDSVLFHDERISGFVAETISINILEIRPDSELLKTVRPEFFLHIISSPEIDTCDASGHLSALVAKYCSLHKDELDMPTFYQLTSRNHMPFIEREASLILLEIESNMILREEQEEEEEEEAGKEGKERKADAENDDEDELTCLQKRCIRVLALHWKDLSKTNQLEAHSILKKLNSPVLLELLDKSLSIAKQRLEEVTKTSEVQRVDLEHECDIKISQALDIYKQEQKRFERFQRDTSERIKQLNSQLRDRDWEIAEYRKELNRFRRLPSSYSFQDIKRTTYDHSSTQPDEQPFDTHIPQPDEPFDTLTYRQYGRRRPTSMPRLTNDRTEDGYLFVAGSGKKKERLPVYYYTGDSNNTNDT